RDVIPLATDLCERRSRFPGCSGDRRDEARGVDILLSRKIIELALREWSSNNMLSGDVFPDDTSGNDCQNETNKESLCTDHTAFLNGAHRPVGFSPGMLSW